MLELEIDGVKIEMPEGSMVMDAVKKMGKYVPHFCYHEKLSVAASCRMCLVEVEKAPKPMPACATPITPNMVVRTQVVSEKAKTAQADVMEFLLLNHPLDCPICDQGGECQLQDLSMGYGKGQSRYNEPKHAVTPKDPGPLISMKEMSRCIHCTRCVRFGQEIAGVMELGMIGRGEHSEITTFVGKTVDSELSGNMIDLCPVGAILSKPFRYSARSWELSRRKSISPHDSWGTSIAVHVKDAQVKRVVALSNAEINDDWISDRDRFSYEGLNSEDRVTEPMIKTNGAWKKVSWDEAFAFAIEGIKAAKGQAGADMLGALASAYSTTEELYSLKALINGLGSAHIDTQLRQTDDSLNTALQGIQHLGQAITAFSEVHVGLVIGAHLREDHPLLAQRLRASVKNRAGIHVLSDEASDLLMRVNQKAVAANAWLNELLAIEAAIANKDSGDSFAAKAATELSHPQASNKVVMLGNAAMNHPQAAQILAVANRIAQATGAVVSVLTDGANTVGAYAVGAVATQGSLTAQQMLAQPRAAYVTLNVEPAGDVANPAQAVKALGSAFVVALSPYFSAVADTADVILPTTPFSETGGTFVNAQGTVQTFNPVVKPLGQSRPAWKVLRVLGERLGIASPAFSANELTDVRAAVAPILEQLPSKLNNACVADVAPTEVEQAWVRSTKVNAYAVDAIVRRAESLQKTRWAQDGQKIGLASNVFAQLGLNDDLAGDAWVVVKQGDASVKAQAVCNPDLADNVVDIQAGTALASHLGDAYATITVERA
ncbi:MAG: nqo3 [Burkholderiaceae bacterium]|nr:nqo3 [Burkholderiaceae bacterium]